MAKVKCKRSTTQREWERELLRQCYTLVKSLTRGEETDSIGHDALADCDNLEEKLKKVLRLK